MPAAAVRDAAGFYRVAGRHLRDLDRSGVQQHHGQGVYLIQCAAVHHATGQVPQEYGAARETAVLPLGLGPEAPEHSFARCGLLNQLRGKFVVVRLGLLGLAAFIALAGCATGEAAPPNAVPSAAAAVETPSPS